MEASLGADIQGGPPTVGPGKDRRPALALQSLNNSKMGFVQELDLFYAKEKE
jgi:hypothetical protein